MSRDRQAATDVRAQLLEYALSLPEAYLDHPWGEDVAKVNRKVFAFFGLQPEPDSDRTLVVLKVPEAWDDAMSVPGAEPAGYGLGKSGWVTIPLGRGKASMEILRAWVVESYRNVAPKRLSARLAADSSG